MILVIDNYDSFTFNLVQYLGEMGQELKVFRNDAITLDEIERLAPQSIVISPEGYRSWVFVSAIRPLAPRLAGKSYPHLK
jgi:anthranilate/para-aminobenzoate synthase component II